jgi:DNA-directed RNA polymerase specialized sigma subunit
MRPTKGRLSKQSNVIWREKWCKTANPENVWEINVLRLSLGAVSVIKERSKEIISLYESGLGQGRIARMIGIGATSVHRVLVASGIERRPTGGQKKRHS